MNTEHILRMMMKTPHAICGAEVIILSAQRSDTDKTCMVAVQDKYKGEPALEWYSNIQSSLALWQRHLCYMREILRAAWGGDGCVSGVFESVF